MDTAFDSQVMPVIRRTLEAGFDLLHISFDPLREKRTGRYQEKKRELESVGIKTLYLRQAPPLTRGSLVFDVMRLYPALRKWWHGGEGLTVHCRGHLNAYRGLLLKEKGLGRMNLVADLRGAFADEVCQGSRGLLRNLFAQRAAGFYREVENQVVRKADKVLCVSNAFEKFLRRNYQVNDVSVIPTFVDTSRFTFSKTKRAFYREKLQISDRRALVYSGGVSPWQGIGETADLFLNLRSKVENLFMLFLTQSPPALKRAIGDRIHPEDMKVIHVPHREVAGYLCAADTGVLLREDTLTNRVASPIKFSEYMCCGLPCIVSEGIGDTAEVIQKGDAGIVLSSGATPSLSEIEKLLSLDREEISKSMVKCFSSEIYLPEILSFYEASGEGGGASGNLNEVQP